PVMPGQVALDPGLHHLHGIRHWRPPKGSRPMRFLFVWKMGFEGSSGHDFKFLLRFRPSLTQRV
ncbi:MAG: hypothetical protein QNI89_17705, partial [Desulfobacterales bacterium]|nr:hypothetical protein [Desulfobacterales bacterium]